MDSNTERDVADSGLEAMGDLAAEVGAPSTALVVPPPVGSGPLDREWAQWLVDSARAEGLELNGPDGVLAGITRDCRGQR